MASGKPDPPRSTYHPLPSTPPHQPPQYYVVLPFYSPSGHRRCSRLCRRYLSSAIAVLLLASAVYLLWPSDPNIKVVNLRVDRLKIHATPKIAIDITLAVTIKVRNRDVYSLDFRSLNVSVGYRGEQLGFVKSDYGKVKAFGTSYVDATVVLDGAEVISDAIFLIEDLVRGEIPFTTTSEVRGSLGILFVNFPIKAKLSCEVLMNTHNQTIERQDCYPAVNKTLSPALIVFNPSVFTNE
ncbi:hypothetical protein OSB04_030210 [Centaurea solstitialis]|uniref:Late embryogenesis abundant protein LEA-2 subgroup domain-containing protein n=1 Tax=Centaurea solstitialis TaxID=347529 RepID=A0AA38SQN4_9ASTR|nr:hypothetical protein OSB04_030210 [Centaurea solstitialis]